MKLVIQIENGVVTDVITDSEQLQKVTIIDRHLREPVLCLSDDDSEVTKKKTIVKTYTKSILDYVKYIRNHRTGMRHGKDIERFV